MRNQAVRSNPCVWFRELGARLIESDSAKAVGFVAVSAFSFKAAALLFSLHVAYKAVPRLYTKYSREEENLQRQKQAEQERAAAQAARQAAAAAEAAKTPKQAVEEMRQILLAEADAGFHRRINAVFDMILCDPECAKNGKDRQWRESKFAQYRNFYIQHPKKFATKLKAMQAMKKVGQLVHRTGQ